MELNHHLRAHVWAFAVGRIFILRNSSHRSAIELLPVLPGRYCRPQFMYVRNRELTGDPVTSFFVVSWGTGTCTHLVRIPELNRKEPMIRVSAGDFRTQIRTPLFAARPLDFYKTHLYFVNPKWNCCLCLYAAGGNRTPSPISRMVFKTTALPLCLRRLLQDAFLINLFNIWKDCCTRPWDYCLYFSFSPQQWNSVHLPPR